jgi:hypothetical protein
MSTSPIPSILSEIEGDGPLTEGTLAYFRERQRNRVHEFVLREFIKSGLSRADFARRIGKAPEQITRWLAAPGNWELDTISDFLLGTTGAELEPVASYPLTMPAEDHSGPSWLTESEAKSSDDEFLSRMLADIERIEPLLADIQRLESKRLAEGTLSQGPSNDNKPSALWNTDDYKRRELSSALV